MKKSETEKNKLSGFWLGPLLVGSFIGIGHGLTERLIILQENSNKPSQEILQVSKPLPGIPLEEVRKKLNEVHAFALTKNLVSQSSASKIFQQDLSILDEQEFQTAIDRLVNSRVSSPWEKESQRVTNHSLNDLETLHELFRTLPNP